MRPVLLMLLPLALLAASASAAVDSGWSEVARDDDGGCALRVAGDGRFFRIAASGLVPGERGRLVVANGDMTPLDLNVRSDDAGEFARYYLPFRWHRSGGAVSVALDGAGCSLSAAFDWRRGVVAVR